MSEEVIGYLFKWHAYPDACPKCAALDQREWRHQDLYASQLIDSQYGPVWDLDRDVTLAHPHCKCNVTVRAIITLNQLPAYEQLRGMPPSIEGEYRTQ